MSSTEQARRELLGKVARLYWEHGLTHQQVADALDLSRVKVTRLLAEARRTGIVDVRVLSDAAPFDELEQALVAAFDALDDAVVVPTMPDAERQRDALARAAAARLQRMLREGMRIAIGISKTIGQIPDHIADPRPTNCTFISVGGSRARSGLGVNPHEATDRLARLFGASARHVPAPAVAGTPALAAAFRSDRAVHETLAEAAAADLVLLGVGGVDGHVELVAGGDVEPAELDALIAAGAVGDVAARFFDGAGRAVADTVDERVVGLALDELRAIPTRLAAAGGDDKRRALLVALRCGLVSVLVTDAGTARALLAGNRDA